MNALEKVAWTELLVSAIAITLVTILYPWLGNKAQAGFGVLGLLGCTFWFVRHRKQKLLIDERDRAIERRATELGIGIAWQVMFLSLICIVIWAGYYNDKIIPTNLLSWIIWIQFSICYGVKGFTAVLMYRKQNHAS